MMQKLLMLLLLRNYFMKEVNGKIKNGGWFGNKLNNYQPLLSNVGNPFTGDSFEEIVGELNNMDNIYRYDNLTNTEGTTDSYCLQDLIFIKSLETNTLQLSSTNKLELKWNDTGAIKNNSNGLYINKYDRHFEIIDDVPSVDNGKIRIIFDTYDSCLLTLTVQVRELITKKEQSEEGVVTVWLTTAEMGFRQTNQTRSYVPGMQGKGKSATDI